MDNQQEKIVRTLLMRITQRPAIYFDVNVTEHCNLNCKYCGSFAPIADKEFLDIQEYRNDITRLAEIAGGVCHHINILGGEPLLHPDICEILKMTRDKFPIGNINLVTNGILVKSMSQAFWDIMRDNRIYLCPTKYPVKVDYDWITEKAKKEEVVCYFFGDLQIYNTWTHIKMDLLGTRNENHSFMHCPNANNCCCLEHGKLYPCPRVAKIRHFNKKFNTNLPVTKQDYIDIYEEVTLEDVMKFLCHSIPFCRFCNTFQIENVEWGISKKDESEWI